VSTARERDAVANGRRRIGTTSSKPRVHATGNGSYTKMAIAINAISMGKMASIMIVNGFKSI